MLGENLGKGGEAQEQVAQGICGCFIPGSVQGLIGCAPEPPDLVAGICTHGREMGTR